MIEYDGDVVECERCGGIRHPSDPHVCPAPDREVKPLPTWPKGHCGQCDAPLMDDDEDAHALLKALAAHLQVELPPDGWRASQYRQGYDGKVLYQNSARAWLGQLKSCHRVVGPFATAAEAAAAVSALEEEESSP